MHTLIGVDIQSDFLSTGYRVRSSGLDALASGFRTKVFRNACRGVEPNPGDSAAAWKAKCRRRGGAD